MHTASIIKVFLNFQGVIFFILPCQNFFSPCISALHGFRSKVLPCLNQHFFLSTEKGERSVAHCSEYQLTSFMKHWLIFFEPGKPWYRVGINTEYMICWGVVHACLIFTSPVGTLQLFSTTVHIIQLFFNQINSNERSLEYFPITVITVHRYIYCKEVASLFSTQKLI